MFPLWHSGIWRMGTNQQVKCWSGRSLIGFLRKRNIVNTNLPLHTLTLNLHWDNLICGTVLPSSSMFWHHSTRWGPPSLGRAWVRGSGASWPGRCWESGGTLVRPCQPRKSLQWIGVPCYASDMWLAHMLQDTACLILPSVIWWGVEGGLTRVSLNLSLWAALYLLLCMLSC